jgi:N-acetylglucosaminyldiphosphoundecaprenol N-acetyl-beta-D-mannosaminyltransferase
MKELRERQDVIGAPIDVVHWGGAVATILRWAADGESRYVCACNVHSVVTAQRDLALAASVRGADLVLPDGAPVAWLMRRCGYPAQRRVSGPDLMWRYFAAAAVYGESIFLYGSTPETLQRLQQRIAQTFPGLRVAGAHSPPFRALSDAEQDAVVELINGSGATTVWVSLGCPKQELWMAEHRDKLHAVLVGVGAAFAFHAGTARRAPRWMRRLSLEWLHRLLSEPRRLWRRYLSTNSVFVVAALRQVLRR